MTLLFHTLFFVLTSTIAFAQTTPEEQRLLNLYDGLRCPTCQGLSIKESDAGFSIQMRQKVETLVQAGKTDAEINDYFMERYGEWILRSPPKKGVNWILWIAPGLAVVLAGFWVFRQAQTWEQRSHDDTSEEPEEEPLTAEDLAMIEKDMKRFERSA